MKMSEAFPSNYLKAADLQGRTIKATISVVQIEPVGQDKENKPVVYFVGKEKGLVLNKTNGMMIAYVFGDDTDDWGGAEIELYPTMTSFAGKPVEAIRVNVRPPPAKHVEAQPDRIIPNAAARAAQQQQYDERNPPPIGAAGAGRPPLDDDIPF